jgi:hypothetical protein
MGGISFDSEDQMNDYIEENSSSTYSNSYNSTKKETFKSSILLQSLIQEEYFSIRSFSTNYFLLKDEKKRIKDLLDYIKLTYYKLYYDTGGKKIADMYQYNFHYRNKYFENWKMRSEIFAIRKKLFESNEYLQFKGRADSRSLCFDSYNDIVKNYNFINTVEELLNKIEDLKRFNYQNSLIKLLLFATYYNREDTIFEDAESYDREKQFFAIKLLENSHLSLNNSFKILNNILVTKKSTNKDFDISYLLRLAEIEEFLFTCNSNANPEVIENKNNIEITSEHYKLNYNLIEESLIIYTNDSNCKITNIHRISNNEKCLRTYLYIEEFLKLKIDTNLEFAPLNTTSFLNHKKDIDSIEKSLEMATGKSYQTLISIGRNLCDKYTYTNRADPNEPF